VAANRERPARSGMAQRSLAAVLAQSLLGAAEQESVVSTNTGPVVELAAAVTVTAALVAGAPAEQREVAE